MPMLNQNPRPESPRISPESRFEGGFYTRRFGPHKNPRFPDSKIVIWADYAGLEGKIV